MLEELPDATRPKLYEPFTEAAPRIYTAFDMGNARGLMPLMYIQRARPVAEFRNATAPGENDSTYIHDTYGFV